MKLRSTTYWKCQFAGWSGFVIVVFVFNHLIYHDSGEFFPMLVSIYILGLLFSHLMKITIIKFGILNKSFSAQVIYLSLLSFFYSLFGTIVWMLIMINLGFWKITDSDQSDWIEGFIHGLFFNLFPVLLTFSGWVLIYFLFHYVQGVRREEQLKTQYQLQMIELEAKALRAQMNPHFIFNCLNSIKSLIQQHEEDKSVNYLTTFSKLIRTLFSNADKKEISLYDEIETCKLYLQLEAMRFDTGFSYSLHIDETIDFKSIEVPALIIQPFVENAIWHGIVPKGTGGHVELSVIKNDNSVDIVIDDNGIGREASGRNKPISGLIHQSKGVNLTQSRLELHNLLRKRKAILQTLDKKDEQGLASGTKVIISINEETS